MYQPWTHPNDAHWLGGSYAVNYQKINKLPPLRSGSVTSSQTARGFVGFDQQSERDLYIKFFDPDQGGGTSAEAGWKVHTWQPPQIQALPERTRNRWFRLAVCRRRSTPQYFQADFRSRIVRNVYRRR